MGPRFLWRKSISYVLYWRLLGIISEEQNLEKLIYEKPNAYVGCDLDIDFSLFCPRRVIERPRPDPGFSAAYNPLISSLGLVEFCLCAFLTVGLG